MSDVVRHFPWCWTTGYTTFVLNIRPVMLVYHICVKHKAHFIKSLRWMAHNDNTTAYWSITILKIKLVQVNIPVYHSLQGTRKDQNHYSPWIMWCMIKTKKHDLQVSNFSLVLHPNSLVRMFLLFLAFVLSVLRGHSVFFHPGTKANDFRLGRISIPDLIHYIQDDRIVDFSCPVLYW